MKKFLFINIILLNVFCLATNITFAELDFEKYQTPKPTYTQKQIEELYNCKYLMTSECYENLLKKIDNDWIRMDYAIVLFNEGKLDEAEKEFTRLNKKHKNDKYTYYESSYKQITLFDADNFEKTSRIYLKKIRRMKSQYE